MLNKPSYEELVQRVGELEQLEDTFHRSEDSFRDLVENLNDVLFSTDVNAIITYISPPIETILGYPPIEFINKSVMHFVHPEDENMARQSFNDILKNRLYPSEFRIKAKNNEYRWVRTSSHPIFQGERIVGVQGVLSDITEQKRAEKDLKESEARFRLLASVSPAGIYQTDINGDCVYVNPSWCRMTGLPAHEALGRGWERAIHPEDRERIVESWDNRIKIESSWEAEYRILSTQGNVVWIRGISAPMKDDAGIILGYMGLDIDITSQKRMESQLERSQKMEAIGTLAGGIAHDFNNILGIIFGCTELSLQEVAKETTIQNHLKEVLKAAQRARDLVQQILTFSRLGQNNPMPIVLGSIVKETLKMLRSALPATISIHQDIQPDSAMILGDPTQMHQIIMNLGTNASQAMDERGGALMVSLINEDITESDVQRHPMLMPGSYIKLSVSDTGCGIMPENLPRIFDPYFTTKAIGEGTGLGLAVTHGIVENHGGTITVHSEPGKGTTFDIYFPRMKQTSERKESLPLNSPLIPRGRSERILFIDDEPALVRMGEKILTGIGYQVESFTDSKTALNAFKKHPERFDLIVTDQTMPQMTGKELARRVFEVRPGMPIILCTGYSKFVTEKEAKVLGIQAYLEKPLTALNLGETIRRILDSNYH